MFYAYGGILYTLSPDGIFGIILGHQYGKLFPFKGGKLDGENDLMAAKREIEEETCGLVKVGKGFSLTETVIFKNRVWKLGFYPVSYSIIGKFNVQRDWEATHSARKSYLEMDSLVFLPLDEVSHFPIDNRIVSLLPSLHLLKDKRIKLPVGAKPIPNLSERITKSPEAPCSENLPGLWQKSEISLKLP